MAHFFKNHPKVSYDLNKDNTPINVQNPLVRFIYKEALKDKATWYYTHDMAPGQSLQYIAEKYYGDSRYDWVLMITNDILDPVYDLPLDYNDFIAYIFTTNLKFCLKVLLQKLKLGETNFRYCFIYICRLYV